MAKSGLIVGLDIGTTKICAVVGELSDSGSMDIVGIGVSPANGMRKGVVVNIDQAVQSIRQAIAEAELMAGCEIASVYAGIAGDHIIGINSDGVIAIKGGEVTDRDVERALDAARAIAIPMDKSVLHVIPQEYTIDDQGEIIDPIGMFGVRLEVKVHIVAGAVAAVQNIVNSCHRSNLDVADVVLESLASAKAILTKEEREIGVAIVDIGGGTSDLAVFVNDAIKYTSEIAQGGDDITKDIAYGLRTPLADAEKIKIQHSCVLQAEIRPDEYVEVPGVGGRAPTKAPKRLLADVCESRMEEILQAIKSKLEESGYINQIRAGVVLTGGTSLIVGCEELAEQILELPVRVGVPYNVGGLKDSVNNPKFATAVGLLRYGAEQESSGQKTMLGNEEGQGMFEQLFARMKKWFSEIV